MNEYFINGMISNAYTLLIIYARIDLIHIYRVCLSCLLVDEEVIYQFKLKLESSIGIYFNRSEQGTRSDPLVLDIYFLLHIGKD